jgi:hypothetical protein
MNIQHLTGTTKETVLKELKLQRKLLQAQLETNRTIAGIGKLVLSCMSTEHFYSAQDIATIAAEKSEVHGAKTFAHFKKRVRAFLNADTLKKVARQEDGEGNRIYKKLN